ncbi:baseplate J/gp47 family protein [Candidatus Solirubrobacter pratensis]|uniref:baseplate J/gp47 family protein n=1 Tax=Candidatus Solirubrobacter pratensis TaxID=1298857 RepID=UPI0004003AE5|nr:baseplate J/gp47 family protein [Candidatus Solirubrobacter pratensis]
MAVTSRDIALQIVNQLKVLDPAISAEIGTPERLLIDAFAQKIADSTIDLTALSGGLDIDSKIGSSLDKFLAIFNFGRQSAVAATGFVTFSRSQPALTDIRIPAGQRVVASLDAADVFFQTTFDVTIRMGETSVVAPIQALVPGALGNVAAQAITQYVNGVGFDGVFNTVPTSGGLDQESDDELKARFKNTVFRNVSGTTDQYLALAIATPYSTKANVVGPISRYREYIQVPVPDDATYAGDPPPFPMTGTWTTAMSTVPFSKYTYTQVPYFVSNGKLGAEALFYREVTDFRLNVDPDDKNRGDAWRFFDEVPEYDLTLDPLFPGNRFRPSITFLNVIDPSADASIQGVRPGDVVLFEHSYLSTSSRNDYERNITNAVDIFVDGGNATLADCVIGIPNPLNTFTADPNHPYYRENYRRVGEVEHRPMLGNLFTPLFLQPVADIPDSIKIGSTIYYRDLHYWLVEDVSELRGTVRARNGIEWDKYLPGQAADDDPDSPTMWTGPVVALNTEPSVTVAQYAYDKNIYDLQATVDGSRQTTTDVLAHKATTRYFKLDIAVMYGPGASVAATNLAIRDAVQAYFKSQYFGTAIQLSDLLQAIHNVPAVDNVRWSADAVHAPSNYRVAGCNVDGTQRTSVLMDTVVLGNASRMEQLSWYFTGTPQSGEWTIERTDTGATTTLGVIVSNPTLRDALRTLTGDTMLDVQGSGVATIPWVITYSANGVRPKLRLKSTTFVGGVYTHDSDFFLADDELPSLPEQAVPGDSVPGLIIRAKAQNTWSF